LRSDSFLCSQYIDGKGEYTLNQIVDIMEEMNFLHTETNYADIVDQNLNSWREEIYDCDERLSKDEYEHEKRKIIEESKTEALLDWVKTNASTCSLGELLKEAPQVLHDSIQSYYPSVAKKYKREKNNDNEEKHKKQTYNEERDTHETSMTNNKKRKRQESNDQEENIVEKKARKE
jgi:hypothetical protein